MAFMAFSAKRRCLENAAIQLKAVLCQILSDSRVSARTLIIPPRTVVEGKGRIRHRTSS